MTGSGALKLAVVFEVENGELKSRLVDSEKAIDALGKAGVEVANDLDRASAATDRMGRELAQTEQAMGRTRSESTKVGRAMTEQSRATDLAERSSKQATATLGQMKTALAGLGLALGAREVIQYADGWTLAGNRLRLVTENAGDLAAMQIRLFDASQSTRSSFEATATLYSRMAQATKDLGISSEELVRVTTTIQQAFRVSGASAQEAENAVIQLAQGLASGTLRGDEFNSVMEQAPRLAQAMADSLNVNRGELRAMAADGKISAETIINALRAQGSAIGAEFATVQATIGDSLTTASNAFQRYVGETDAASGVTVNLAKGITFAANNMDLLVTGSIAATGAMVALNAAGRMSTAIAGIRGATGAMAAFNAVVRANPIGLLASLLAVGAAAFLTLSDNSESAAGSIIEVGKAIGLTNEQLQSGTAAIDVYVDRIQKLAPAQLKAAQDSAKANLSALTGQLQDEFDALLAVVRDGARGYLSSSDLNALLGPIEAIVAAGDDLSGVQDRLAGVAAQFEAMGRDDLASQIRGQLTAVTDASAEYDQLRLVMLSLAAQADIMSGAMGRIAQTSASAAKQVQTEWAAAFKAYSDGQRKLDQDRTAADLKWDKERQNLQALIPALQGATLEYDSLTRQIRLNDSEARTAQRTQELLAENQSRSAADARAMAEKDIAAEDKLTREREKNAARVAAANARLAESLDIAGLQAQHDAIGRATIAWDDLAGAYVVVDREARIAAKALDLLRSGAEGSRAEAEKAAAASIDLADATDRERRAKEKLAEARSRDRELSREVDQIKAVTIATGQATLKWDALAKAYVVDTREARILARVQEELNRNSLIGADRARELATQWVDATDAQTKASAQTQALADKLNEQAKAVQDTADTIQGTMADMGEAIVFDGSDAFRRLMDDWKRQAFRAAVDIATTFARAQVGSALNLPELGGSTASIPRGILAAAGLGSNLAGGGTNSLLASGASIAGGLFNGFSNSMGSSALSYALGHAPQTMVDFGLGSATNVGGQLIAAPTQLGSSLAGGINSAGWGVLGSTAAQLLGFEARNPYVGTALTTVGSISGGIAGTAAGAAIGGTLGAAGGPIGAVAGAALGQILSSYIGSGASVGPNAAGSLTVAGGRFAVGGVGADNGGDASAVTAQLQQAATTINTIMDQLQLTVTDSSQSFWKYGLGQGAASPYKATSADQLVQQVLSAGLFSSSDANVQQVLGQAGGRIDPASFQADLQFAAQFDDAINAWAAASAPAAQATAAAAAEMEALKTQIEDFRATTVRLGLDTATADNVTKQHVETLFGIREAAEPLGAIATYAANANERLAAAGPLLEQVGISAEDAAAGVERSIGRMGVALRQSIEGQLNAVTGRGAFTTISQILTETEAVARELAAGGQDTGALFQLRDTRIAQALSDAAASVILDAGQAFGGAVAQAADAAIGPAIARLDAQGLQDLIAAYPKQAEVVDAATRALAGMSTAADLAAAAAADAAKARQQAMQDETRAMGQAATSWRQISQSLTQSAAGLRLSPSAALSPQNQLREAEAQYQSALQLALSGDQAAAGTLPQLAAGLQEAGLKWFGPSSEFYGLQDQLQADLAEAAAVAGDQASIAEQQLSVAEAQLAELQRIAGGGTASNPLTDFFSLGQAVQAGTASGDVIGQQHAIIDRLDPAQLSAALGNTAVGGQAQAYIRQRIGGGLAFDPAADAAARVAFTDLGQAVANGTATGDVVAQRDRILSQMGPEGLIWALGQVNPTGSAVGVIKGFLHQYAVPGFAAGGSAGAGMVLVGESGPELVNLPRPAEIIDHGTSRRWIDAAAGGGDSRQMLALLQRLVEQNERLLRGSGRMDAEQIGLLADIRAATASLASEASRAASRPRERVTA